MVAAGRAGASPPGRAGAEPPQRRGIGGLTAREVQVRQAAWSPTACRISARSPSASSSARRPRASTSPTCSPSSACTPGAQAAGRARARAARRRDPGQKMGRSPDGGPARLVLGSRRTAHGLSIEQRTTMSAERGICPAEDWRSFVSPPALARPARRGLRAASPGKRPCGCGLREARSSSASPRGSRRPAPARAVDDALGGPIGAWLEPTRVLELAVQPGSARVAVPPAGPAAEAVAGGLAVELPEEGDVVAVVARVGQVGAPAPSGVARP